MNVEVFNKILKLICDKKRGSKYDLYDIIRRIYGEIPEEEIHVVIKNLLYIDAIVLIPVIDTADGRINWAWKCNCDIIDC